MRPVLACVALVFCLAALLPAQDRPGGASFSGTVVQIERIADPALPRVRIRVRLAQPAALAGQVVAFSEWDGLWAHPDRYRVGQVIALTLYPISALGLTSEAPNATAAINPGSEKSRAVSDHLPPTHRRTRSPRVE